MNAIARTPVRSGPATTLVEPPRPALPGLEPSTAAAPVEHITDQGRWFLILGIPFVLGAAFFALALGLDAEWPITLAFFFGPFLLIAGYIYLCLTSDSNTE